MTVRAVRPTAVMAAAHRPRRAGVTSREGRAVGDHRVKVEVISVRFDWRARPAHLIWG